MILIRSLAFQLCLYVFTAVAAILGLPLLLLPWRCAMMYGATWAALVLKLLQWCVGLRHEVRGREHLPAGPAIIAMKHQSAWDTFAVPVVFGDAAIVFKKELMLVPFYGWYVWKAGMIAIDRKAGAAALRSLVAGASRAVGQGRSIVIFPEGTRTAPGTHRPYQPGVAALYRQLGLPVVPVALNSGLFWGRRHFLKRPGRITLEILPPIPPGRARRAFMAELEERIERATDRLVGAEGPAPRRSVDKSGDILRKAGAAGAAGGKSGDNLIS
ncbi:MAG TPA: lysophospholipid acyltransferase family protein [Stellaceae bacterium]|nr:lysophospholipid acyltransferase family protein [Stellaceae bacterium]